MVFETIALLKGTAGSLTNNFANVLGYYTSFDGGGGNFYWDDKSIDADNGGTIFRPTSMLQTDKGRWKRLYNGSVYIKWFGAKANGTEDDSVYIQNLINAFSGGPFLNNKNLVIESDPNAKYGIASTVYIPYNISINFNNATIIPLEGGVFYERKDPTLPLPPIAGKGKYLFLLNAKDDGSTIAPYSGNFPSYISNMYIDNSVNQVSTACIFYSRSKHLIENIRTWNIQTLFFRDGNSDNEYNDSIHLNRIVASNSQNTTTAIYINNSWLGDNLKIEDLDLHGAKLNVAYCLGGVLDRIINADMTINNCYGLTISNTHLENGNINVQNSVVKLSNILHFYQGVTPLTITNGVSPFTSLANKSCIIENYNVEYDDIRDVNTLPGNYSTDVFDAFINGNVIINNFFRMANNGFQPDMTTTATRITLDGTTSFDDYNSSPANSISSVIVNGAITSSIQSINNGIIGNGISNKLYINDSQRNKFLGNVGTYYYRAVFLLGDNRCKLATVINAVDINFTVTLFEPPAPAKPYKTCPVISNNSLRSGKSFTLRLYRAIVQGSYNYYVDIPLTCFDSIIDYGFYTSTGHYWQPITPAGPIEAFNTAPTGALFSQNADGTKVVKLDAAPLLGKWKVGDKIEKITPGSGSNGWICTSASPLLFIQT